MLVDRIADATVIDLFAGSGALGLEALSRGAAVATFVELSEACASILRRNLDDLAYGGRARVIRGDAVRWLNGHPDEVAAADIVFLDPPYADASLDSALRELDRLTVAGAVVVAEHARSRELPEPVRLQRLTSRRYGDSAVTIFEAAA